MEHHSVKIKFDRRIGPTSSKLENDYRYWIQVLWQIVRDFNLEDTLRDDNEFKKWLLLTWGITLILDGDKEILGADISDQMVSLLLLKFPREVT